MKRSARVPADYSPGALPRRNACPSWRMTYEGVVPARSDTFGGTGSNLADLRFLHSSLHAFRGSDPACPDARLQTRRHPAARTGNSKWVSQKLCNKAHFADASCGAVNIAPLPNANWQGTVAVTLYCVLICAGHDMRPFLAGNGK